MPQNSISWRTFFKNVNNLWKNVVFVAFGCISRKNSVTSTDCLLKILFQCQFTSFLKFFGNFVCILSVWKRVNEEGWEGTFEACISQLLMFHCVLPVLVLSRLDLGRFEWRKGGRTARGKH